VEVELMVVEPTVVYLIAVQLMLKKWVESFAAHQDSSTHLVS
jgi:hypothetical protein